jgi:hypothetical protein
LTARVATSVGCFEVDLEDGDAELVDDDAPTPPDVEVSLPLVVAADRVGSRVVAVVARRPPLVISDDAGLTWREAGGGLPAGTAVAVDEESPDRILFASEARLFLSEDGGLFWRALPVELIGITAVAFS